MNDFAQPLTIPRPKTRTFDRIIAWVNSATPYIIGGIIGAALGIGQGYFQCDRAWKDKIVTRATADKSGEALAVYEDQAGNVYYSRCERRNK